MSINVSEVENMVLDESPYSATDEEWAVADKQFMRMVQWIAHNTARRLGANASHEDFTNDIVGDLRKELFQVIARYKRQCFVVSCIEYFTKYPEQIPSAIFHKVQLAMYCWKFRRELGPKHGFKPIHDAYLAKAMESVNAPIDFRWSSRYENAAYLKTLSKETIGTMPKRVQAAIRLYLFCVNNRRIFADDSLQCFLNDSREYMSELPPKPCRSRPFFLDTFFHPYVKRILINFGNKMVQRRVRLDGAGYMDIDEFSDMIPDTRMNSGNPHAHRSDTRYKLAYTEKDVVLPSSAARLMNDESYGRTNPFVSLV